MYLILGYFPRGHQGGRKTRRRGSMLPRTGFLVESRSCPVIGPGLGKPESKRFTTLQRQGPESIGYDLPPVQVYKNVGSNPTPKLGPGFGQITRPRPNLFTPPCSPDKFYERRPATPKPAPRLGPGPGRPMSPRTCTLVPPGCGADTLYNLPSPEAYKQRREPGVPRWDPAFGRFPKERRFETDQQYTLPSTDVYLKTGAACTTRLGPGPGLPSKAYGPRTAPLSSPQGADALYSLPSLSVRPSCT